jgi:hypothetical protein
MNSSLTMDSPLGPLTITASNQTITAGTIGPSPSSKHSVNPADADVLGNAASQLGEYFEGYHDFCEVLEPVVCTMDTPADRIVDRVAALQRAKPRSALPKAPSIWSVRSAGNH